MTDDATHDLSLVCRIGGVFCALPVEHVVETMRPLPVEMFAGAPGFVSGLSIIRGAPVPVVDAGSLLGRSDAQPTRFVSLRAGGHRIALAVSGVVGVRAIAKTDLRGLPPLLGNSAADIIAEIGALDARLLVVLQSARLVPDSIWALVPDGGAAS